ncbi:hypothetical protein SDC9_174995 [bioreactor metagenome]|uniref:Uncharacterized protein n=1 Tax=bioreactor metagenome TaxID=1076179 RepID=A0A645GKS7_9ZZZZ
MLRGRTAFPALKTDKSGFSHRFGGNGQYRYCFSVSRVALNDRDLSEWDIRIPKPAYLDSLDLVHAD